LNANEGYTINGISDFESNLVTILPQPTPTKGNFKLLPKPAAETTVTREEIDSISFDVENIDLRKLEIIKKIFNLGNVSDNMIMDGLQVKKSATKVPGAYTLVLVAKLGYTINR
jgi:hypothetical protein